MRLGEFFTKATYCNTFHLLFFSHPLRNLERSQDVLLTHGDSIDQICDNFRICATSSSNIISGIYNEQARIYGVQFHPEVDLTVNGKKMLSNFLLEIAKVTPSYTLANRKEECIRYIRETVGNSKVLVRYL